ncbi:integrase core domain-containing protein [Alteromonas macleodii]
MLCRFFVTEYNEERPHDALNDLTPWEHLTKHELTETSNYRCN